MGSRFRRSVWPWPRPERREVVAGAAIIAILAATAIALLRLPYPGMLGWGFGPEWSCSHPGQGDPVCVREPPAKP
jgi:hypothetical protein